MLNKKLGYLSLILLIFFSFNQTAHAQLETLLERYTGQNAEGYLQPLVTAFGGNLNSGLYRTAKVPKGGLHLDLRLNAMMSLFSDDQKTFTASTQGYFYPPETVETATVIGNEGATVTGTGGTQFRFPDGYDIKSFPTAVPTLTIGSIAGTEASVRFASANLGEDVGTLTLYGFGVRHSISQYIPLSPVHIAAGVFYQNFKVGDIIKSDVLSIHAEASKSFLFLELYGGIAYEKNKASVNYTFTALDTDQDISIDITGNNKFRTTLGVAVNLLMLHVHADYNLGNQNIVNAGISIGL